LGIKEEKETFSKKISVKMANWEKIRGDVGAQHGYSTKEN